VLESTIALRVLIGHELEHHHLSDPLSLSSKLSGPAEVLTFASAYWLDLGLTRSRSADRRPTPVVARIQKVTVTQVQQTAGPLAMGFIHDPKQASCTPPHELRSSPELSSLSLLSFHRVIDHHRHPSLLQGLLIRVATTSTRVGIGPTTYSEWGRRGGLFVFQRPIAYCPIDKASRPPYPAFRQGGRRFWQCHWCILAKAETPPLSLKSRNRRLANIPLPLSSNRY